MTFPVFIPIGPWRIHPHLLFETLSYFIGFRVYLALRRRAGDTVIVPYRWATLSCAAAGAALGARSLAWLANPEATWDLSSVLLGGKTIVGGLIGGLIGVELVKLAMGIRRSTGDLYAPALAVAIAIGRVGCLLTGVADDTSGIPTSLPWGMDLGDGVARHPTQVYEIVVLAAMVVPLWRLARRTMAVAAATGSDGRTAEGVLREGDAFKAFMVGYLGLRILVDFVKPYPAVFLGLGVLQWACALTIAYYAPDIWRWVTGRPPQPRPVQALE
ncbi:MAG: prolipoprotein diacylglyceryl transferase family protein [Vicinamibacteraceae bacterium]